MASYSVRQWGGVRHGDQFETPPPQATASAQPSLPSNPVSKKPPSRDDGWSLRDNVPYPRFNHTAILDEALDRMIVFGGGATDTWALALSGPSENRWTELSIAGPHPPAHAYVLSGDSAVFDPVGRRMIVAPGIPFPRAASVTSLWQLSLDAPLKWTELFDEPLPALNVVHLAFDSSKQRLFLVGDNDNHLMAWSRTLEVDETWARLPDPPWGFFAEYDAGSSLVYDSARDHLVMRVVRGEPYVEDVAALSLADGTWTLLRTSNSDGRGSLLYDPAADRLLVSNGSGVELRSPITGEPVGDDVPYPDQDRQGQSAVFDVPRRRILYFEGEKPNNSVSALNLDTNTWSEVVPATRSTSGQSQSTNYASISACMDLAESVDAPGGVSLPTRGTAVVACDTSNGQIFVYGGSRPTTTTPESRRH